tara:strand:+ start:17686 stop:17928 length:243 start_codon:yes stop_codon:yes gene_type:complete
MSTEELPQSITFNLQQGLLVHSMIDVMTKRGAFIADELKPVGELYDFIKRELKIEEHLKRLQAAQKKQEESSSTEPVTAE